MRSTISLLLLSLLLCGTSCSQNQKSASENSSPVAQPKASPSPKPKSVQSAHETALKKQDAELVRGLQGQLLRISMPYSLRLKRKVTAWIYLPPNYKTSSTRYPVAYLLHGAPGEPRDLFVNARVHRVAESMILQRKIAPLILVSWDGNGPGGPYDDTYYLNRRDGYAMENFTVKELVPWIDRNFRTKVDARSRALIGFSAGGYGAVNLGLKHPDIWRVMASHSGFFDPNDDPKIMTQILGNKGSHWDANNPLQHVRKLTAGTRLHLYMDVGHDDALLGEFRKMEAELKAQGIDYEAQIFTGAHTWSYLTQHYQDSLRFVDRRWKEMAQP